MIITRRQLSEMIAEAVKQRLYELKNDDSEGGDQQNKSMSKVDASNDDHEDVEKSPADGGESDDLEPEKKADKADAVDRKGEAGEEPSGAVNDEVSGKTVQGISIEPESSVLPGAKEVVFTFNESTDPLKLLITQTGAVKFFWRGQLFDMP